MFKDNRKTLTNTSPAWDSLGSILVSKRVFEELGSDPRLTCLLDDPPKLLFETDVELKLNSRKGTKRITRVYVFDRYFVVGEAIVKETIVPQRANSSLLKKVPSENKVLWFASRGSFLFTDERNLRTGLDFPKTSSGSEDLEGFNDDQSSVGGNLPEDYETMKQLEAQDVKNMQRYNLLMFVDLMAVNTKMVRGGSNLGMLFTYVTRAEDETSPGDFNTSISIESAEVWFKESNIAKDIMGAVQEAVSLAQMANEEDSDSSTKDFGSLMSDSLKDNAKGVAESTASKKEKKSTRLVKKTDSGSNRLTKDISKRSSFTVDNKVPNVLNNRGEGFSAVEGPLRSNKGFKKMNERSPTIALEDEGLEAEFTVIFKNPTLGFALSSSPQIGPFVCDLEKDGLAELGQVTLGDRIISINNNPIPIEMGWSECVAMIKNLGAPLKLTFLRKQKDELNRLRQQETKGSVHVNDVFPTDRFQSLNNKSLTASSASIIAGNGIEKRMSVQEIIPLRKNSALTDSATQERQNRHNREDLKASRKNRNKIVNKIDKIDSLFAIMRDRVTDEKKMSSVLALQEIFETEKRYLKNLNILDEFKVSLSCAKLTVLCKDRKTGLAFCEHRRPQRLCSQPSKYHVPAVDPGVLDSVFLNIKPIIAAHFALASSLEEKLDQLYETIQSDEFSNGAYDLLNTFVVAYDALAPTLQFYWTYSQRYTAAAENYTNLLLNNERCMSVIEPLEKAHDAKLGTLLSTPIERVSAYPAIYATIVKHAREHIEGWDGQSSIAQAVKSKFEVVVDKIERSMKLVNTVAEKITVLVGQAGRLDKMLKTYQVLGGNKGIPDLVQPFRHYVDEFKIAFQIGTEAGEIEGNCMLFLFNDMLAIASRSSKSEQSWFRIKPGAAALLTLSRKLKNFSRRKEQIHSTSSRNGKIALLGLVEESTQQFSSVRASGAYSAKVSERGTQEEVVERNTQVSYDVIFYLPLLRVLEGKLTTKEKTFEGEGEIFGLDLYCDENLQGEAGNTHYCLWFGSSDRRTQLKANLTDLIAQQRSNKVSLEDAKRRAAAKGSNLNKKKAGKRLGKAKKGI